MINPMIPAILEHSDVEEDGASSGSDHSRLTEASEKAKIRHNIIDMHRQQRAGVRSPPPNSRPRLRVSQCRSRPPDNPLLPKILEDLYKSDSDCDNTHKHDCMMKIEQPQTPVSQFRVSKRAFGESDGQSKRSSDLSTPHHLPTKQPMLELENAPAFSESFIHTSRTSTTGSCFSDVLATSTQSFVSPLQHSTTVTPHELTTIHSHPRLPSTVDPEQLSTSSIPVFHTRNLTKSIVPTKEAVLDAINPSRRRIPVAVWTVKFFAYMLQCHCSYVYWVARDQLVFRVTEDRDNLELVVQLWAAQGHSPTWDNLTSKIRYNRGRPDALFRTLSGCNYGVNANRTFRFHDNARSLLEPHT